MNSTSCTGATDASLMVTPSMKKNCNFPERYPFPIVRDSCEENAVWECIIGQLKDHCVEVINEENMELLFSMGFFGKGSFSRSTPQFLEKKLREQRNKSKQEHSPQKKSEKRPNEIEIADHEGSESDMKPAKWRKEEEMEVVLSDGNTNDTDGNTNDTDDNTNDTEDNMNDTDNTNDTGDNMNDTGDDTNDTGDDTNDTGDDINDTGHDTNGTGDDTNGTGDDTNGTGDDTNDTDDEKINLFCGNAVVPTSKKTEKETLQLTFEEAFFLSYGLGVLVVKDKDQPLDLMRLWRKFCDLHPSHNFPVLYTAYHHFRSKGWIVRSGMKYGTDFSLYKDGPPFYHSSYVVIVKPVKEQNLRDIRMGGHRNLTWSSLAGLNRMCTHVSKAVIILYVIKPATISENKMSTPFCISQYKLEEVLVHRWVPSTDRAED